MSENMSQNTENDFLDQTFKDIDSSVSLEESDDNATQEVTKPAAKKAGLSTNMWLLGGGALAMVGIGAFWFLGGGQQAPQQQEVAPAAQETAPEQPAISFNEPTPQQEVAPAPTPEPLAITPPAADPLLAQTPVDPFAPTAPAVDPFASTQNIPSVVMPEAMPQLSEPVPSVDTDVLNNEVAGVLQGATVATVATNQNTPVEVQPQLTQIAPTPVAMEPIQSIASNAPQTAHVDELRGLFDKHSVEIDKLDIRVTALEAKFDKSVQEQMAINKRVEERLAKLEQGGVSVSNSSAKSSSAKSGSGVSKNTQRKRVKKASTQKQVSSTKTSSSKVTVTNEPNFDSTTLVDKRDVVAVAKPKQQSIDIHSVFSGRLWIKNPDSTLSTFAVGEAIPGGEKIKRIDEVSRKIYTDKRVISY